MAYSAMKFGKQLAEEAIPGWRYVDYARLKSILQDLVRPRPGHEGPVEGQPGADRLVSPSRAQGGGKPFHEEVKDELVSVESFLATKQEELHTRISKLQDELYVLKGWVESDFPDTEKHLESSIQQLTSVGIELAQLLQYINLNVSAARKILKKYHRVTGHHAGPGLMMEGGSLKRLSDPRILSEMVEAVQLGLEEGRRIRQMLLTSVDVSQAQGSSSAASFSSEEDVDGYDTRGSPSLEEFTLATLNRTNARAAKRLSQTPRHSRGIGDARRKTPARASSDHSEEAEQRMSFESFLARQLMVTEISQPQYVHGSGKNLVNRPLSSVGASDDSSQIGLSWHVTFAMLLTGLFCAVDKRMHHAQFDGDVAVE